MTDAGDKFQKELAKLQIQASAIIAICAVLIALGLSSIEYTIDIQNNPYDLANWRSIIFTVAGIGALLYYLVVIRNDINNLKRKE